MRLVSNRLRTTHGLFGPLIPVSIDFGPGPSYSQGPGGPALDGITASANGFATAMATRARLSVHIRSRFPNITHASISPIVDALVPPTSNRRERTLFGCTRESAAARVADRRAPWKIAGVCRFGRNRNQSGGRVSRRRREFQPRIDADAVCRELFTRAYRFERDDAVCDQVAKRR